MSLRPFESLFNWPTFDLWEIAPSSNHHNAGSHQINSYNLSNLGAVDVSETDKEFLVVADAPGMTNNDVKVEVKGNMLQFSGKRNEEHREESADKKFYRLERSQSSFSRSFRLPATADVSQIKASCQDGVLKISVGKKAPATSDGVRVEVAAAH